MNFNILQIHLSKWRKNDKTKIKTQAFLDSIDPPNCNEKWIFRNTYTDRTNNLDFREKTKRTSRTWYAVTRGIDSFFFSFFFSFHFYRTVRSRGSWRAATSIKWCYRFFLWFLFFIRNNRRLKSLRCVLNHSRVADRGREIHIK